MRTSRNTIQRDLILAAVRRMHNHPTADEVYNQVSKAHPSISRATVYRNLGVLADQGEIRRVTHLNAADRFDFQLHEHFHLVCTVCGGVHDVELDAPDLLLDATVSEGFHLTGYNITFSGLCPHCNADYDVP